MPFRDLSEFVAAVDARGELHRVPVEVDPILEIAEITRRVSAMPGGGPALYFEQVNGSVVPVVTNLFGSLPRTALALGVSELGELTSRFESLLGQTSASIDLGNLFCRPEWQPATAATAPCQEVVLPELEPSHFPLLKNWPQDGRFLTLPLVFTRSPDGVGNCGIYRVEWIDRSRMAIHWRAESDGARQWQLFQEKGEKMPVAIAIGGDPALLFAASFPLPAGVDEILFAGFLRDAPLQMVSCRTVPLAVPAAAEAVIEGYIEPGEMTDGALFGNHTGYYASAGRVPVLRVQTVTCREKMVFPATVVGPPPQEDCYMAKASERLLLPLLRKAVPQVTDINLPVEWVFQPAAVVAVHKSLPGEGKDILRRLWSNALRRARLLVLVDDDVDIHKASQAAWRSINDTSWSTDLIVSDGERLGIDATRKLPGEPGGELCRVPLSVDQDVAVKVSDRWKSYGF